MNLRNKDGNALTPHVLDRDAEMFCNVLLPRELFVIGLIDATQAGLPGGLSMVMHNHLANIGRRGVEDLSWKFIL